MKWPFMPFLMVCAIAVLILTVWPLSTSPSDAYRALAVPTFTPTDFCYLPLVLHSGSTGWTGCDESSFGTMLIHGDSADWITPADVLIHANDQLGVRGMTGTGAPSEEVKDEWFGRLPGWTRSFMRGTYDTLTTIHWAATSFGMESMYECFAYGPESPHQAGEEALDPVYWVPQAEALAEEAGKCLIYAPAVRDYEYLSTPEGESQPSNELLATLIAQVAPHVDIWIVQLGKYQPWVDRGYDDNGNPYSMDDLRNWVTQWVSWIKAANPSTEVWTQLGIGVVDPIQDECLPPQPAEYILEFREALISAGVDGVWVMPSQPCMPCPPSPSPGFICSTDPQDNEYYRQSLARLQSAIEIACGQ
ncbi:MAG: hypothetical protein GTO49_07580 [Anaerolineae bacterium]|nr:hypothetical protein [Anaerolineae bacterium]